MTAITINMNKINSCNIMPSKVVNGIGNRNDVAAKNVSLSFSLSLKIGTFGEMNKERKHGTESEALDKTKKNTFKYTH